MATSCRFGFGSSLASSSQVTSHVFAALQPVAESFLYVLQHIRSSIVVDIPSFRQAFDSATGAMCTVNVTCTVLLRDPFSDMQVVQGIEFDECGSAAEDVHEQTIAQKTTFTVPILDSLPHLRSWRFHPPSTPPSTSPSLTEEYLPTPIRWTDADLMYLLTCLFPSPLVHNQLILSPPLASLPCTSSSPIHLHLHQLIPPAPPPRSAYSKHLPIGTGRPAARTLHLASSSRTCYTAHDARRSLASSLLANKEFVIYMLDRYSVLATLYAETLDTLEGLYRGMIEMLGVGEKEWGERYGQLCGEVDGTCVLEARVEVYLLGMGRGEVEWWVENVEMALELEGDEREGWGGVYRDAAEFLGRAVGEMEHVSGYE
ncbi:hypothetical protein DE146DRAFT_771184 [Phaeosphaeria sp. MPI-PUGE-AT-0046c]|nr:hypothetical protein DE146DRAFT_771184 [Phaeosphaeria sp. MPI-PUGE-AT-0046c]